MPPEVIEFLWPWPIVTFTTALFIGMPCLKMLLNHRRDIRIAEIKAQANQKLSEQVTMLREEVCFLRDGVEEANDRLAYHDRLISRGIEEPVSTPV